MRNAMRWSQSVLMIRNELTCDGSGTIVWMKGGLLMEKRLPSNLRLCRNGLLRWLDNCCYDNMFWLLWKLIGVAMVICLGCYRDKVWLCTHTLWLCQCVLGGADWLNQDNLPTDRSAVSSVKISVSAIYLSVLQHSLPEVTSMEIWTFSPNRYLDAGTKQKFKCAEGFWVLDQTFTQWNMGRLQLNCGTYLSLNQTVAWHRGRGKRSFPEKSLGWTPQ